MMRGNASRAERLGVKAVPTTSAPEAGRGVPLYREFEFTPGLPPPLRNRRVRQNTSPVGQDSAQLKCSLRGSPPVPREAAPQCKEGA